MIDYLYLKAFAIHTLSQPWAQREIGLTDEQLEATGEWELKMGEFEGGITIWIERAEE